MKAFDYEPIFKKTVLNNGVRILTEHHPYTRATSVGFYVDLGTRDEPESINGAAHFLEHLLFKGTTCRSAYQIVADLEAVGGEINAYTSREHTCFHAATLRDHSPISLEVLGDLISNATLEAEEVEKEREVVLQEIDMSKDQLEEYIFDLFFEKAFGEHPLGRPILGTPESLSQIGRQEAYEFYQQRYHGQNLIVAVSGDVDHDSVVQSLGFLESIELPSAHLQKRIAPEVLKFSHYIERPSEQIHLAVGFPSGSFKSDHRFEAYVVNALLGGGMTSRLYQNIREEKALAYNVYSYLHSYTDSGLLTVYAATSKDKASEVLSEFRKELDIVKKKGLSKQDLDFYKTQVMGQVLLGADDIENRMNSIAINEMVFKRYRKVDEVVAEIEAVSCESVREYIDLYLDDSKSGVLAIGDLPSNIDDLVKKYF